MSQMQEAKVCYNCPLPLDIWAFCPAIFDAAWDIHTQMFDDNKGVGVLIVQGAYVLADPLLVREASAAIWLGQEDLDLCKIRYLID